MRKRALLYLRLGLAEAKCRKIWEIKDRRWTGMLYIYNLHAAGAYPNLDFGEKDYRMTRTQGPSSCLVWPMQPIFHTIALQLTRT